MKFGDATMRRVFAAGLIGAALPSAAAVIVAVMAGPPATGATDPCAASEVARTIGSVAKSMGDYLDSHPETNGARPPSGSLLPTPPSPDCQIPHSKRSSYAAPAEPTTWADLVRQEPQDSD